MFFCSNCRLSFGFVCWAFFKGVFLVLSSVDYGLIAIIAFASSFFGAFGKELADFIISHFRKRVNGFGGRKY